MVKLSVGCSRCSKVQKVDSPGAIGSPSGLSEAAEASDQTLAVAGSLGPTFDATYHAASHHGSVVITPTMPEAAEAEAEERVPAY